MPNTLVIVESPAKCGKIEKYLGPGYKCIASYGHIQQLNGLKSIDISNNFNPNFSHIASKGLQISKIRKAITDSDEVMLATDDDREGEAISWHICKVFGLSTETTKRIIFHEVTKPALERAVKNPKTLDMNIVYAQLSRQVLDLLVGYKISPVLWANISRNSKTGLSAGRCQTPALRIVYDNQKEIECSPGRKVYNTTAYFTKRGLPFVLGKNFDNEDSMGDFLENSVEFDHIYKCNKPKKTTKTPPSPFTTSTLQQTASSELRISPKETMKICQKLYELGKITYMRTDSKTYCSEFIQKADKYITKRWSKEYVHENIERLSERTAEKSKKNKKTTKKTDSTTQEAHEAIRPTEIERETLSEDLSPKEHKMYKLIWCNTVESCMSPANYMSLSALVSSPEADTTYKYSTEQVVFPGWKVVRGYTEEEPMFAYLQTLKQCSLVNYSKIMAKVSMKDLKAHYTEAKLVQLLEQKGIGRPSTFSSLIDKIQERGYVKKDNIQGKTLICTDFELIGNELSEIETSRQFGNEKNKLVIQPLGVLVLEFLLLHYESLFNYTYTAEMEKSLDVIAKGEKIWYELCDKCLQEINRLSGDLGPVTREVIKIDDYHTYMIAKYGPVIKYTNGDDTSFKPVKKDIDLDRLRRGEYSLVEIIEAKSNLGRVLGEYEGDNLILKTGKYGLYVVWGENKKNLNYLEIDENDICLENVVPYLQSTPGTIRVLNHSLSIRNGKYGDYIFYKTKTMTKPKFLKLKGLKLDYKNCDKEKLLGWIKNTYNI